MTEAGFAAPSEVAACSIAPYLTELLEEITAEWDHEPITETTVLGSLGIESINLVYLLAEAQIEYRLGDALMSKLRAEEIDVRVLRVGELAAIIAGLASDAVKTEIRP